MENVQVPEGYDDYCMEISFMNMQTGRSATKRVFIKYNGNNTMSYYAKGDDKETIWITEDDLKKTILGFQNEFEGGNTNE